MSSATAAAATSTKRCCLQRDESAARRARAEALPPWLIDSRKKLYQFEKYAYNVFGLPRILNSFSDSRLDPTYPTFDVANSLFHAALLRLPSINALEGDLKEADFQQLLGFKPQQDVKAFSADVIANVLDKLDLDGPRQGIEDVIWKAERNKAFREGSRPCAAWPSMAGNRSHPTTDAAHSAFNVWSP